MSKMVFAFPLVAFIGSVAFSNARCENSHYPANRPPLSQKKFVALPLGSVKPQGWLKEQLTIQANGLTGHLDEFWPSLSKSAWNGGDGEAWERGPYYLDGLVPLAYLSEDERLLEKIKPWIEWILSSQQPNGWFGPPQNKDRWPLAVAMKVLTQYHEATNDPRVIPLLKNYFKYLSDNPPDWPDGEWRGVRAMENVVSAYWLYNRTGDPDILKVAESIQKNSFNWISYFLDFPYTTEVMKKGIRPGHPSHVVNIAMAIKHPGVWYQQSQDERDKQAVYDGIGSLDKHHGQVTGRFGGDEHLSGRRPTQGTELCGVVEYMFSLENLIEVLGDVALADRLELLAYNANPGTCTPDYWAHQYDQQANQVLCTVAKRDWSTNGDSSNIYGLEPNYGCCTSNMHQGWPKFVSHMWMATHDNGLAAVAYGPNEVKARVADGVEVTITEETEYPFDGSVEFAISLPQPTAFPLYLRIPAWADGTSIRSGDETIRPGGGTFAVLKRTWKSGDAVKLDLPMKLRTETRYNNSVSVLRGPLYFSLKIGERYEKLKSYHDTLPAADWAIHPTTPWNYGLILDRENPQEFISTVRGKIGKTPFAQETAPVILKVKGRAIPNWKLVNNSAGDPPISPVKSDEPITDLEMIPYGCTRLRITEFPVIEPSSAGQEGTSASRK
ncbi:MAG: glycoside hydrolase family 127 protein [bacterium]|nr:glycoside hydrolase family 127 protein [bacterium]